MDGQTALTRQYHFPDYFETVKIDRNYSGTTEAPILKTYSKLIRVHRKYDQSSRGCVCIYDRKGELSTRVLVHNVRLDKDCYIL